MSIDPTEFYANSDNRSAQVIHIESSKVLPILVILAVLCGLSISISWLGYSQLRDRVVDAETETRLLEYYVQGQDAIMVSNGLKNPGDDFSKFKRGEK